MTAKTERYSVRIDQIPVERKEALREALEVPRWLVEILLSPHLAWSFDGLSSQAVVSVARGAQEVHGGVLIDGQPVRMSDVLVHIPAGDDVIYFYRSHRGAKEFREFIRSRKMLTSPEEMEQLLG